MNGQRKTVELNLITSTFGAFCCLVSALAGSLLLTLCLFTLFSLILVIAHNDKEMTNPICIFSLFYYPYSTWNSFYLLTTNTSFNSDALVKQLQLCFWGLVAFSFGGLLAKSCFRLLTRSKKQDIYRNFTVSMATKTLIILSGIFILIGTFQVAISGASTKHETYEVSSIYFQLSIYAIFILLYGAFLYVLSKFDYKKPFQVVFKVPFLISLIVMVMGLIVLAKRDFISRFIIGILIIYFSQTRKANSYILILILASASILMPLFGDIRGILLPNNVISFDDYWDGVFLNEFRAPSRNLYWIIESGKGINERFFLFNDMFRALLSPFGNFLETSSTWFNITFRAENQLYSDPSGWGFTLVGNGYLYGGFIGVFLLLAFISIVLHLFYLRRFKSRYWFIYYILILTSSIFCIRSDLSAFLTHLKISGLTSILYWYLRKSGQSKKYKQSS